MQMQFKPPETDSDGSQDTIVFNQVKLTVTYRTS